MNYQNYKESVLKDPRAKELNFDSDGRIHYIYRVTRIKDKQHYYGSRSELLEVEEATIGYKYFTSSDYVKEDFKKNPSNYYFKVIRYFNNRVDKIIFESYLHQKFNVKAHRRFFNRMNCTPFGIDNTGNPCSVETKEKMSMSSMKNSAEIKADPIRREKRRQSLIKMHIEIKADPKRKENRHHNQSAAAFKAQAEIKLDLVKYQRRCERSSNSHSVAIYQFDENWVFVKKYKGAAAAAVELGYPGNANIIAALTGRSPHYKKQHWILEKDYTCDPMFAMNKAKQISNMHKKPILLLNDLGEVTQEFGSANMAGKKLKINPAVIVKILAGYGDPIEKINKNFILKDINEKTIT